MIRVLVAEDMRILRDMLVSMLNLEDDIKVVAQVADGAGVVPAALAERPDLAVLDIDMPEVDGLTAAAELHKQLPACRVVILTVLGRPGQLRQALSAHVSGFLVKDTPSEQLVGVLRRVAAGERVIDPKLALATPAVGARGRRPAPVRGRRRAGRDRGGAVPVLRHGAELPGVGGHEDRRP
jgi:two-component system response regulator DesR